MDALKEFLKPELIWFLVGLLLLLGEFMLPGLIIAFFAVGAWVVAVVCLITQPSLNTQLIVFVGASVASLLVARGWLKGLFQGFAKAKQDASIDLEDFVGQRAVVIKAITPKLAGKIDFHGTHWTAEADAEIAEGSVVKITHKDNLTLKVKLV